jgi:hypothetical protein
MKHQFTDTILSILTRRFGDLGLPVFENSPLLQYLNVKTRSANRGSKARGAFANHYALYVLVEDYISKGFLGGRKGQYEKYEGARFTDLFRRQRELPFGAKLQNHALNSRLNDEFAKYFPTLELRPIMRDQKEQRYWITERLLIVKATKNGKEIAVNIAEALIDIIDAYVETKRSAFEGFISACRKIAALSETDVAGAIEFVKGQLQPNVDARVFEIVSFAVLKAHYGDQSIFWGWTADELQQEYLVLYKTGRTNANDGGIDFVMKPLGRFFQVTETIDVNKYFLDIDKIQRFPLTFVVKTTEEPDTVRNQLREQAQRKYGVDAVVARYMEAVEEVINIPALIASFEMLVSAGHLEEIMSEIIRQSRVEFNYDEDDEDAVNDGDGLHAL